MTRWIVPFIRSVRQIKDTAVILHRSLRQLAAAVRDEATTQEVLTCELQTKSLDMRMFPLSTIFSGFKRAVRDMATSFGKDIHFEVQGGEIELDKKIIDKLGDPLIHLIIIN